MKPNSWQINYEKNQNFNFVTSYLHKVRYKNLLNLFGTIKKKNNNKINVVDIGCGVGKAYELLNANYRINYYGIEANRGFYDIANERYGDFENFEIVCDSVENQYSKFTDSDIVIGLETFEHIPENLVVRVIEAIADSSVPLFYCTVPNEVGPAILIKNLGSFIMGYSRHKEYSWKETISSSLYNLDNVGVHGSGHKGFDWRWLAQTIRYNLRIVSITTSPFNFIPKFLSPSIGFIARSRKKIK